MSVSFDWRFSDDTATSQQPNGGAPPPRGVRHWLRRGVVAVILLLLVGLPAGLWVRGRLKALEQIEAELTAIVELELKAIVNQDQQLFRARQDPVNLIWQERQVARYFESDGGQFAPAPGLTLADRPAEIKQIHVRGRTGRAELTHWYQETDRTTVPLPFHVTWFYRQDQDGSWYHVAPPSDYWGVIQAWQGIWLDIRATGIEAQTINPIAPELTNLITRACYRLNCPEGNEFDLDFEDVVAPDIEGRRWSLPALSLTGLPEDEKAHEAWSDALKLWLVEALAETLVQDENLTQRVIYRQLVQRLQAELGLMEPTATEVDVLVQAVSEEEQRPLWSLWQANMDPSDPERTRLLKAEVDTFLEFMEEQVGPERVFELLPALGDHYRLGSALLEIFHLDLTDFSTAWLEYLSEQTGVSLALDPLQVIQSPAVFLLTPPTSPPPPTPPGDQIALNCGGRIWVGNADGSDLVRLTSADLIFSGLHWSPDGRWLLTTWRPYPNRTLSMLYLLAADGSDGRLLTEDLFDLVIPIGWSPDGGEAIYATASSGLDTSEPGIFAVEIETGATRRLPGMPVWSPDGERLAYSSVSTVGPAGTIWLADADWQNAREIAAQGSIWPGEIWSPDSSMLAISLSGENAEENAIAIYDLATESFWPAVTAVELTTAVLDAGDDFASDGADRTLVADNPLERMWSLGWSADARHLLVWARKARMTGDDPTVLATVPLDAFDVMPVERTERSAPQLLYYGVGKALQTASWSPADPNRLTFAWLALGPGRPADLSAAFILDLNAGPVYNAAEGWTAAWSPDGAWVAFAQPGRASITDRNGQERFVLTPEESAFCFEIAWNPAADLGGLQHQE